MKSTFIIKVHNSEKQQIKIVLIKPIENEEIKKFIEFFMGTLSKKIIKEKKKKYIFTFKKVNLGFSYLQMIIDSFLEEQLYKTGIRSKGVYNENNQLIQRPKIKRTYDLKLQRPSIFEKDENDKIIHKQFPKNANVVQEKSSENPLSKES